jgi:phage tail sheath protein FI
MLIVDPRAEWTTAEAAIQGVRDLGYASPNMLGYYPRVLKHRSDDIARPAGGALAGLLCKQDRTYGPWHDINQQGMGLHRRWLPAVAIDEDDALQLGRAGLNAITPGPAGRARLMGAVTMGRGSEAHRKFAQLPVRRFCLQIINAIAGAAKWAVFEPGDRDLARRVCAQITTYFHSKEHGVTILLVFHPLACDEPVSLTLHLTAAGCRVGSTAFAPTIENCA